MDTEYYDYNEYEDYPEIGYQDSQKENDDKSYNQRIPKDEEQFQDILFQRNNYYQALDNYRTEKYIFDMIRELTDRWGVSESFALKLLKKNSFNRSKAERNLEDNPEFDMMDIPSNSNSNYFDCPICYSSEKLSDGCSFDCGHLFCKDCFIGFLENTINEGLVMRNCPFGNCNEVISPKIIEKYLKNTPLASKYKKFLIDLVVSNSESLLWCPAPKCGNTLNFYKISKSDAILSNIRCDCGHCFCLQCKDQAHRPLKCEKYQKWIQLIGGKDDSLNEGWIKKNTKKCPQCKASIEKNQGCMHMTCRMCKYEFCWLCNGDWKQHGQNTGGFYDCNKYKTSDKEMDDTEREFEKFNFYRDRYEQHWSSLQMAITKKKEILTNFKMLNDFVKEQKDDSFLKDTLDLIIEARRAITMTYAVGYYLKFGNVDKEIFEMQQSMLWEALDGLDKYTDDLKDPEKALNILVDENGGFQCFATKFNKIKSDLNSRAAGVTTACNKLLKYIELDLQEKKFKLDEELPPIKLGKTKSKIDKDYWYCAHCTYANKSTMKKCEICQRDKKVLKNYK